MTSQRLPRYFGNILAPTRPTRRRPHRLLRLEVLEGRDAPAALVSAVLNGNILSLTGLDSAIAADSNQQLTVVGTGAGSVDVRVGSNTEFQSTSDTTLSFNGVSGIDVDLRAGDDIIAFDSLNLNGFVNTRLGSGADRLTLDGDTAIGGALSIDLGAGDNAVVLGGGAGDVAVRSLSVTANSGNDSLTVAGASFASTGALTIDLGAGDGNIMLVATDTLSAGGGLSVKAGAGNDTVVIGVAPTRVLVGNVRVTLDPGTEVALKDISLNLGAGDVDITIAGASLATDAVRLITGDGADSIEITSDSVTVARQLSIDTGQGQATAVFGSADTKSIRAQEVMLRSGSGDTTTSFNSPTTVGGNVVATRGVGHDTFAADDFSTGGSVLINNGGGGSDTTFAGATSIGGNFILLSLDGFDRLTITGPTFDVGGLFQVGFGSGGSNVSVRPTTRMTLANILLIRATAGEDVIHFAGKVRARSLNLDLGEGSSTITFDADTALTGALSVLSRAGNDVVRITNAMSVGGAVNIMTGAGNDAFNWAAAAAGSVGGMMKIRTDAGDDTIAVSNVTINGDARIDAGAGNDEVRLDDVTLNDRFTADLAAGNDRLLIAAFNSNNSSTFAKGVAVTLGGGNDLLDIGVSGDANDFATFQGAVRVDAGRGTDTLRYLPTSAGGTRANVFAQALAHAAAETVE